MKKNIVFLILFMLTLFSGYGISSFYGLNGLNYIPSARTAEGGSVEMAITSLPAPASTLNIYPYALHGYVTFMKGLEMGFTNTYQYYFQDQHELPGGTPFNIPGGGFTADQSNTFFPYILSFKFAFLDDAVPNGSLAVGFEYPLGLFFCFDYLLTISEDFYFYFIVGFSTTVATLYGFGGVLIDVPSPLSFCIEGSYGGDTDFLTRPQEVFFSIGVLYDITDKIAYDVIFRMDSDMVRRLSFGFNVKV